MVLKIFEWEEKRVDASRYALDCIFGIIDTFMQKDVNGRC